MTNKPNRGELLTEWAEENGRPIPYSAPLDNYEPVPRNYAHGTVYDAVNHEGERVFLLTNPDQFGAKGQRAVYLLDDGHDIIPVWTAGYAPDNRPQILKPFPMTYPRRMRGDGRGYVDMSGWSLGPHTVFHLTLPPYSLSPVTSVVVDIVRDDDGDTSWIIAPEKYKGLPQEEQDKYNEQDQARLDAYNRDEWLFCGVIVKAMVDGREEQFVSLWGIESDSGEYFNDVVVELLDELRTLVPFTDDVVEFGKDER